MTEPSLATALGVAGAGAVGSMTRWLVAVWTPRWGTLIVNIIGSLAIGLVLGVLGARGLIDTRWRPVLVSGFLGGFTTYSSFAFETVAYGQRGELAHAAGYVAVTLVAGIAACWIGLRLLEA